MAVVEPLEPPLPRLVELALGLGVAIGHQEWRAHAACRGTDVEFWHPRRGDPLDAQRAICRGCEVREPCLEFGLAQAGIYGGAIYGGSSGKQRRLARTRGWDAARLLAELDR